MRKCPAFGGPVMEAVGVYETSGNRGSKGSTRPVAGFVRSCLTALVLILLVETFVYVTFPVLIRGAHLPVGTSFSEIAVISVLAWLVAMPFVVQAWRNALRRDTADLTRAQQRLDHERARLLAFIESSPAAIAMFDRDMRYIAVSNGWIVDYRLQGRQVIGRSHYEVFENIPDRWKAVHQRCLKGAVERNENDAWLDPTQGVERRLRWEVRPWFEDVDGRQIGGIAMFTVDLTESLALQAAATETAERLELALDAGGLGCWDWNIQTGEVVFDERFAAQLGLEPHETRVRGEDWLQRIHPDDVTEVKRACMEHVEGRAPVYVNEHRLRHADGSWRWMLDKGKVVERAADGTPRRMVGTHTDITATKHAEAALREHNHELERARTAAEDASRSKSEFLANMSHEIRTPLTAILGYAELLRNDPDVARDAQRRIRCLDTICSAGTHLMAVLNDILDLSKIEAGKMSAESIVTSLQKMHLEVNSLMQQTAQSKGIRFAVRLGSAMPDLVRTDPTRLRQILLNMAGNAIKFTDAGSVTLTTRAEQRDGAWRLIIDIEDTGPGLPQEQVSRLFNVFTQADGSLTRRHGGTGLGLSISRRFAQLLGGDVTLVWTELGRGSCFRIDIALDPVEGAEWISQIEAVHEELSSPPPAAALPRLSGRILLAEDGLDNQRLITHHLQKAGAVVDVAENGRVALAMLTSGAAVGKPYDLLVTDIQMPEMDGYSLARAIRADGNDLPIIALTAHTMTEDRDRCLAAGCTDFASKPINSAALIAQCDRLMRPAATKRVPALAT